MGRCPCHRVPCDRYYKIDKKETSLCIALERETDESVWNLWVSFTILLAVVAPVIGYLQAVIWGEPNLKLKEWLFGTAALVIINLLMFYFVSYFFWKTSLWLGGQCEKSQMRIVFVWSTIIPVLVFGSVDTIFKLLLGKDNLLVLLVNNIGVIWSAVIAIASMSRGQVHWHQIIRW